MSPNQLEWYMSVSSSFRMLKESHDFRNTQDYTVISPCLKAWADDVVGKHSPGMFWS